MNNLPDLPQKILEIYTSAIKYAGAIALAALIIAGISYLTSGGDPSKTKDAKNRIWSAFFGILILLSSYLILNTISPVFLGERILPTLPPVVLDPLQLPPPEEKKPDILLRTKEIANNIKNMVPSVTTLSNEIQDLTNKCDCSYTEALCLCAGGQEGDACEPKKCYSRGPFQPCPDGPKIKEDQQKIIAFRYEILYYKNRAIAEALELEDEVKKIAENINYYQQLKNGETIRAVIDELDNSINKYNEEKTLKTNLATRLKELADFIQKTSQSTSTGASASQGIESPMLQISLLPDKCEYDPPAEIFGKDANWNLQGSGSTTSGNYGIQKCQASCKTGAKYGCHDKLLGCQPDKCSGGNPCPVSEIQSQNRSLSASANKINTKCDEILSSVQQIIDLKTIYVR